MHAARHDDDMMKNKSYNLSIAHKWVQPNFFNKVLVIFLKTKLPGFLSFQIEHYSVKTGIISCNLLSYTKASKLSKQKKQTV